MSGREAAGGDDPAALLERARALYGLRRLEQARALCAGLVAAGQGGVGAWTLLAQCCFDLGEHEEALRAADQALAVAPGDGQALRTRALVLLQLAERRSRGRGGEGPVGRQTTRAAAQTAARAAVAADPQHWFGHALVSRSALPADGEPSYGTLCHQAAVRARELAPLEPGAHFTVGRAAEAMGRLDEAESCYRAALAIDPEHRASRNHLGRVQLRRGDIGQAATSFAAVAVDDHRSLDPGLGAHNLRAVVIRLLNLGGLVSLAFLVVAFVATSAQPGLSWTARLVFASLAPLGWGGWALWARRRLPRGMVRPLFRLSRRTAHVHLALAAALVQAGAGLLVLLVPPLDPPGPELILGSSVLAVLTRRAGGLVGRRARGRVE